MTKFGAVNTATELKAAMVSEGGHVSNSATYVSGTGTAGTVNTAQTVITRTIVADSATQLGDRVRVRVYLFANSASPITATLKIGPAASEVTMDSISTSAGANPALIECWIHYIDNTHFNIIKTVVANSLINQAGVTWNASQNLLITQNQVAGNFITVFGIFVDVFPKAV